MIAPSLDLMFFSGYRLIIQGNKKKRKRNFLRFRTGIHATAIRGRKQL